MDLRNRQITVGELLDKRESFLVLEKHFGQFARHPMLKMARGMTLQQLLQYAPRHVPKNKLDQALHELEIL